MRTRRGMRRVAAIVAGLMLATSGIAAAATGLAPRAANAAELAASADIDAATQSAETYLVHISLQDPAGGLSDSNNVPVNLGQTLNDIISAQYNDPFEMGDRVMFGDGSYHTFLGWESPVALDKPLEATDFFESNGTYNLYLNATWSGASTIIAASNATDIPANGKVDLSCIDAWQAFCDRIGGEGAREYPVGITHSTLNTAQQQTYNDYVTGKGFEGLATLDIAFDEYLGDGSDGTLDVAKHDLTPSDVVTFDLTLFELQGDLGLDSLSGVYAMRIPDEGGEPEFLTTNLSEEGNLQITDMTATGTVILYAYKDVAEPWGEDGELLPYTIENGVMTFPDHPELGAWYQLTVEADEGITFSNPGGGTVWTMTIDAADLSEDDPLFSSQPNSGIYFVRGDGQGMSTNLWVDYPADKALSYELSAGAGTISRAGGPNTLAINLSAPSTLKLRAASETVIANEDGATLTHQVGTIIGDDGSVQSDDAIWSMLTLVTKWVGGDAANAAGAAVNTAIAGVTKMFVYDIHLVDPLGAEFEIPADDSVTVTMPIPLDMSLEGLRVFHVADDGTVTDMNATVNADAGTVSFTASHFSTFVLANVTGTTGGQTDSPVDKGNGPTNGTLANTGDASLVACAGAAAAGLAGAGLVAAGSKRRK